MQINPLQVENKKIFWKVIQLMISLSAMIVVGYKVYQAGFKTIEFGLSITALFFNGFLLIILMGFNWYFESLKWQLLVSRFERISLKEAVRDVMTGIVWGWVIPFTMGDVLARSIHHASRLKIVKSIFYNRLSSGVIAALFGIAGAFVYFQITTAELAISMAPIIVFVGGVGLFFLAPRWLFLLVLWSFLRYIIIAVQMCLIFKALAPDLSYAWLMSGVGWIFFFRSFIPGIWGSLGVRELSALIFFECCMPVSQILIATLTLWMINLVLPSILVILTQISTFRIQFSVK